MRMERSVEIQQHFSVRFRVRQLSSRAGDSFAPSPIARDENPHDSLKTQKKQVPPVRSGRQPKYRPDPEPS